MTTTLTTNFSLPIPPLDSGGTTDGYATLMQTADTAILNASGKGAWVDYSSTSTVVGWSLPLATRFIKYKKIGSLTVVCFYLVGTSNSISTTFTLPNASASGFHIYASIGYVVDNGVTLSTGASLITSGTSTVVLYPAITSDWTSSGTKIVAGQFFYEVA